jgi:hypothetical protein
MVMIIKTQFTIHVGPIQILLKPRVCGKQISAAFRKPADTVESELHCSHEQWSHSPLFQHDRV